MIRRPDCSSLSSQLPPPGESAAAHCERLIQRLRNEIAAGGGAIPFGRFMELALYAPGLGYYTAGSRKFGDEGDFVTAPEISPLFARCLARQIEQILPHTRQGEILEIGAGTGALAAQLIEALAAAGVTISRYRILDVSADLRERQQERLRSSTLMQQGRIEWLDEWPQAPFEGVVVANEVLDAMPVERFRVGSERIEQAWVAWEDDRFVWRHVPASVELTAAVTGLGGALEDGYTSEINLALAPWFKSLGACLSKGAAFFIDYGFPRHEYYHPQRHMGTLMCHYRHRAHPDPLVLTGLQDITAHVDFTAVAEAGEQAGLTLLGYTTQANFLLGTGLISMVEQSDPADVKAHLELTRQVQKLTSPSELGELFKVMALGRGIDEPLIGFSLRDLRGRL